MDSTMADAPAKRPVAPRPTTVMSTARCSDPAVHAEGQERIFRRCWVFVGSTDQLRNHNDFLTSEVAGTSVVVRNFDGEIAAFHNVCTHRRPLIHNEKFIGFDRADKVQLGAER